MSFFINFTGNFIERSIHYIPSELSMLMEPGSRWTDFSIMVNDLFLEILDSKAIDVLGYFPSGDWVEAPIVPPHSQQGELLVKGNFDGGFSYRPLPDSIPVYCNSKTHWVCVGDPDANGEAVEFIRNCIAVIDAQHQFKALWMRLDVLPDGTSNLQEEDAEKQIVPDRTPPDNVRFTFDLNSSSINKEILFSSEDGSLNTEPSMRYADCIIPFNRLFLGVVGNMITDIGGSVDRGSIRIHSATPPKPIQGMLKIANRPDNADFFAMAEYIWPIHYNNDTHWLCVGNPLAQGTAVEFIRNCIAVIDSENKINCLWIKPKSFSLNDSPENTIGADIGN